MGSFSNGPPRNSELKVKIQALNLVNFRLRFADKVKKQVLNRFYWNLHGARSKFSIFSA